MPAPAVAASASLPLTVLYGVLGAVAVSLGKGLQKYGVDSLATGMRAFARGNRWKLFVWCLGTAGIVSSAFFIFAACAHGPLTIVGALSGTGLVALVLFSTFVLKEPLGNSEKLGIAAIVVGTFIAGYFDGDPRAPSLQLTNFSGTVLDIGHTITLGLCLLGLCFGAAAWSWRRNFARFGLIFGSISGVCGGISVFFQKGAVLYCQCGDVFDDIPAALRNPFFYLFALTGILDFLVTQYALSRAKAVTVVPCYQTFSMLVPMAGGVFACHDALNVPQVAGIALLLCGVVLLSVHIGKEAIPAGSTCCR